jgi:acyl-CoA synthetase (AMP-forming)/AMP-acid ligase II
MTLMYEEIKKFACQQPKHTAIIFQGNEINYEDFLKQTDNLAEELKELGIKTGDRVAVLLENVPEYVFSFFAINKIGAIVVPVGTRSRDAEIVKMLRNSDTKAIVFTPKDSNGVEFLIPIEEIGLSSPKNLTALHSNEGIIKFSEIERKKVNSDEQNTSTDENTSFCILFTSGTTGDPKKVVLREKPTFNTLKHINENLGTSNKDRYLLSMPITSSLGCITVMLRALLGGAAIALVKNFKAKEILQLIDEYKITVHPAVPTMMALELLILKDSNADISSLRSVILSGAPVSHELCKRIQEEMGCEVFVGYGLSESISYVTLYHLPDNENIDPDAVKYPWMPIGYPLPGVEIILRGDDGKEVKPGAVGEIVLRDNGYMDDKEWLITGDLAVLDKNGCLVFWGRKKDLIIRGGFNIYPLEIENVLNQREDLESLCVLGIPDEVMGEKTVACIIPKAKKPEKEEIRSYCGQYLSDYKVPDFICFVDEFPLNPMGKVDKQSLMKKIEI